jgi:hypothetical protein
MCSVELPGQLMLQVSLAVKDGPPYGERGERALEVEILQSDVHIEHRIAGGPTSLRPCRTSRIAAIRFDLRRCAAPNALPDAHVLEAEPPVVLCWHEVGRLGPDP